MFLNHFSIAGNHREGLTSGKYTNFFSSNGSNVSVTLFQYIYARADKTTFDVNTRVTISV